MKNDQSNTNRIHRDDGSKRNRLWVILGAVLNTTALLALCLMPLSLDKILIVAVFRFGSSDDQQVPLSCHLDSCTSMHICSLLLHMWIITAYPEIVHSNK